MKNRLKIRLKQCNNKKERSFRYGLPILPHNVAVNLKRIRTSKGMSLDVLSEQTGVSKSMLAQIEKGTANPSLGVLGKITSGLRIEFQELIEAPPMESCLVTPDQMTRQRSFWDSTGYGPAFHTKIIIS